MTKWRATTARTSRLTSSP